MNLYSVIWKEKFIEKLAVKHAVETDEVEEVLFAEPHVRLFEKDTLKAKTCTPRMDGPIRADV